MDVQGIIIALDLMTNFETGQFHSLSTTTNVDDEGMGGSGYGLSIAEVATAMDGKTPAERITIKDALVDKVISENPGGDPGE